ncbi:hypothetical protein, partial [Klebsiella pneumoniae]|uniref:hypothetical protein n=1 Tax=Klebsiella pneumoniae TaxID=573 RepID=UPI001D0DFDEA
QAMVRAFLHHNERLAPRNLFNLEDLLGLTGPSSLDLASLGEISSPPGGDVQKPRGFWFNVNAELIVYGAT